VLAGDATGVSQALQARCDVAFGQDVSACKSVIQSTPADRPWLMPDQTMTSTTRGEQLGFSIPTQPADAVSVIAYEPPGYTDVLDGSMLAFKLLVFC
jgi:hypothetical protein